MVEPEDAKPESRPCPNCGRFDRVANVAAVREHEAEPGGSKRAIPAFGEPGRALLPALPPRYRPRTRPTRLGRRLSPMPLSSAGPLVVTGLFAGVLAAGGYELHKGSVQYGSSFPFGLVPAFVGAAAVSMLLAAAVRLRLRPVRRGWAAAEQVSRLGWYCSRCGTVYFQPHQAPEGAEDSRSYSLAEFRRFVFRAGGYEHLVNVRSVR